MEQFDVVVIGAGAAGMFLRRAGGQLGCRVLLLDNGKKPGRKILMSGGGRCNFTNMYAEPAAYLSNNPHFCKSALARYTQWDFIDLINRYGIAYHEKTLGQLFCDDSAQQVVDLLVKECELGQVTMRLRSEVLGVEKTEHGYALALNGEKVSARSLVVASGGLSMPGLGASPFGYKLAEQFGLKVLPTRAGLVPFTLHKPLLEHVQTLSGVSVPTVITAENGVSFRESILFTHRGLSGPAVLQLSSYWQPGEYVSVNLLPDLDLTDFLDDQRRQHPNQSLKNTLALHLPKRLVECLQTLGQLPEATLKQLERAAAGGAGRSVAELARAAERHRRLPHGGSDARRRRHQRTFLQDDGSPQGAGALFYRRSGGRDRVVGRLQLPVGLELCLGVRPGVGGAGALKAAQP